MRIAIPKDATRKAVVRREYITSYPGIGMHRLSGSWIDPEQRSVMEVSEP